MKKFSLIVEEVEDKKYFRIRCDLDLNIEASSEGEASYKADSIIASIENQSGYNINKVEEISNQEIDTLK